jgi:hypothetical protein
MRFRPSLAVIFALGLLALNSCGAYNVNQVTATPVTTGTIRFINGSPTIPAIDFTVSGGAGQIAALAYATISTNLVVLAGPYTITANVSGTTTALASQTAFTINAGAHYTVVASGTVASPKFTIFTEPNFTTPGAAAIVNYHDASAAAGAAAIPVGTFTSVNGTLVPTQLGTVSLGAQTGALAIALTTLVDPTTGVASASVGFYAFAPATTQFLPSGADPTDTTQIVPFGGDHNIQLYLIDGPTGAATPSIFVGIFDFDG